MTKKLMSRRAFTPTTEYLKISDIIEHYNLTEIEAQEIVAKRKTNGIQEISKEIGRRVFIEKDKFEEWLKNGRN